MRAVICNRFNGYKFSDVDNLVFDEFLEHYASAQWLAEQEEKAAKGKK